VLGGLFELVSCPHYFAEIVIYLGLLLLTQGSLVAWLMNVWVVRSTTLACNWSLLQAFSLHCDGVRMGTWACYFAV
jgi:steroid 5-alpha reductase family enzyme